MKFSDIARRQNRAAGKKLPSGSKFASFETLLQVVVIQIDAKYSAF